jgi:hypothetical protein
MKKRWIILSVVAACFAYLYFNRQNNIATFNSRPRFDGTFVLRGDDDPELSIKYHKYGTRFAKCFADFCRLGTTRKDSEAFFQRKSDTQALYCYDITYVTGVDNMPPKIAAWFDANYKTNIDLYTELRETAVQSREGYFDENICLLVGTAVTSLELPSGGGGSILREYDSELGPPKWLADSFAKAGLR